MSLTEPQRAVLARLAREPGEGVLTSKWVEESCGPGSHGRLSSLVKRGLAVRLDRGWYCITSAGRALLSKDTAHE